MYHCYGWARAAHPAHLWELQGKALQTATSTCFRTMGIPLHLHCCRFSMASSQAPLERARGTADRQPGTELCLLPGPTVIQLPVCLPGPSALCNRWHFETELLQDKSEKITSLPCAFKRKRKKNKDQEDAWHDTSWTGCPNNCIFEENFTCSNCFGYPPSHSTSPGQLPGMRAADRAQPSWGQALSPGRIPGKAFRSPRSLWHRPLEQGNHCWCRCCTSVESYVSHLHSNWFNLCHRD